MTEADLRPTLLGVPTREQLVGRACIRCGGTDGRLVSAGQYPVMTRSGASVLESRDVVAHAECTGAVR